MTRTRDVATQGGLVLLNTTTFSAQSSVSISNIFTSTYAHYKLIWNGTSSADAIVNLRARVNATDVTTSYYSASVWNSYTGTSGSSNVNNGSSSALFIGWSSHPLNFYLEMFPSGNNLSFTGLGHGTDIRVTKMAGASFGSSPATGFTLFPTSGTITGTIEVYGYK